jgi:hypothetical protein
VCAEAICRAFPSRQVPLALKGLFLGYNDLQEGFEGLRNTWLRVGRGMRGFFSAMVRGVSDPREGSEILTLLFRP